MTPVVRTSIGACRNVAHERDAVGDGEAVVVGAVPLPGGVVAAGVDGQDGVAE